MISVDSFDRSFFMQFIKKFLYKINEVSNVKILDETLLFGFILNFFLYAG